MATKDSTPAASVDLERCYKLLKEARCLQILQYVGSIPEFQEWVEEVRATISEQCLQETGA